ncbi:MAG: DNA polymerase III subunit beta [Oscillospiraceae bacterium]|nr:DNA polymerase III subunit beta [Oscillospiraceae bacterium]
MKIICEKEKLLKGINSVVKGVSSKTTMPILEGILFKTNKNELQLTTYDLEIGIEYVMECNVEREGNTVVNAVMFSEIIRKLPDSEINIEINENNLLVIECEGSLYKLATMNADEFPELPKINIEKSIEIDQSILKNMIRKTIFAVSIEENRPIFTGCLFEVIDNKLNVVAIDGFRMGWVKANLSEKTNDFKAVIPGKTLNEVNKIVIDSFDKIKIGVEKNQAVFEMENCKIVTRLLDGDFLNYTSVIPSNWETRVRINKNILQNCFERVSLISSSVMEKEKKYPVKIKIEVGKITISCANQTGDAKEEIYIETEGKELEIGVNPKYFLDALKVIEDDEVFVSFGTSISPCVINPTNEERQEYTYMILPIRMKEE